MPVYLFTGTDVDPNPNTFAGGSWNNTVGLVNTTSTLTTSWQRFTHTTAAVSSTANAIILQFNATETGTAGANDYFEITGVQLEFGDRATPLNTAPTARNWRCARGIIPMEKKLVVVV